MKLNIIIQRSYGIILGVIGANHLFHFFPTPAYAGPAARVYAAFQSSGYVFPAVGVVLLLTATTLLLNRCVVAGLLAMLPVLVNMLLFHLFLVPAGIVPALLLSTITGYLLVAHPSFRALFPPVIYVSRP